MKIKIMALAVIISSHAIAEENGFYLGGKVGVESVKSKMEYSTLSVDSFGSEGAIYGIVAGYNFAVSSVMYIGLEAEYLFHNTEAKFKRGSYGAEISLGDEYGLGLLLGHPYSSNVNVYGRLGVTRAKSELKDTDGEKGDDTVTGWHGGFGVEFKNDTPLTFRTEYRYSQYKEIDYNDGGNGDNKLKSHVVSLSAVYNF